MRWGSLRLQHKVFVVIGATFLVLFALVYATSRYILLDGYANLETREAELDLARVVGAYQQDLSQLDELAYDWAAWDDTYAFVESGDQDYITSNLVDSTFTAIRINFLLLVDARGEHVVAKGVDLATARVMPVPPELLKLATVGGPLLQHGNTQSRITGIVRSSQAPIYFSSRPIVTSNDEGPIRGALIMGRLLDDAAVKRLAGITQLSLRLLSPEDPELPRELRVPMDEAHTKVRTHLTKDGNTIRDYAVLADIFGKPAAALEVRLTRNIYAQGQLSLSYFFWSVLGLSLVFLVLNFLLIEKLVVSRVRKLSNQVARVDINNNGIKLPVSLLGEDELSYLASNISDMLTKLQQSSQALRQNEELYRQMFERNKAIKLLIEPETGAIVDVNTAACDFYGYTRNEFQKKSITNISAPTKQQGRDQTILTDLKEGNCTNFQHQLANGELRDVEAYCSPLDVQGRRLLLLIVLDITRRKQAESQLRIHQEKLAHVARLNALGEMTSGIAHELNQPLSAIVSYTSGCSERLLSGDSNSDDLISAMEQISSLARRAGEMIQRLRDFSRKGELRKEWLDINTLVQQVLQFVEVDKTHADIKFILRLSSDVPRLQADPIQIEQVIFNLVRNGIEAMETVKRRELVIETAYRNEETIEIGVRDTGPGLVGEANYERLFEAFFTTKPNGIGLGLSISRSIVEAHGGTLRAEENPGGGLVFRVILPVGEVLKSGRIASRSVVV